MTKRAMQFYHRYDADGTCKVICMDCYATLGSGCDRDVIARMEAAHICGDWKRAADDTGATEISPQARRPQSGAVPFDPQPVLPVAERFLAKLHPAAWVPFVALLLYIVPTVLEILARRHVNTWLAVILPGDIAGCAVLVAVAKMPKTGILLYALLTAAECYEHVVHVMHGVTMAWQADLVPTLVVIVVLLMRMQRAKFTAPGAFS